MNGFIVFKIRMKKRWSWILGLLLFLISLGARANEELTYTDLVKKLTDLEGLAALPQPGEKCAQWSSYDRLSAYDVSKEQYIRWGANGDGTGYIREENGAQVIAEMDGPGCIWRIWSARPEKGHVKIYLDGQPNPVVDLPFSDYFNLKNPPFIYPSLVHTTSSNPTTSGYNSYIPIPYQKSCKIIAEQGWGRYYHINYSTFPKGTTVPTFQGNLSSSETAALKEVDEYLSSKLGSDPVGKRKGEITEVKKVTIQPGETSNILSFKGGRAITTLKIKMPTTNREDECFALRELALKITWDGNKEPSVWTPLGDFFGTAMGIHHYRSLPMGMEEDGFYSYWYMPFQKSALLEITNDGDVPRQLEVKVTHAPLSRPIEEFGRFHAKWHRDAFLLEDPDRWPDWPFLLTKGRGRFVGLMLHVWNPKGGSAPELKEGSFWWGEGDEKFFVDGEKFPSTFGTGTEDYFGYAWCSPELFQNAYHNQTLGSFNCGHVSVNRWQITENVPFQTSFDGIIEKYFPAKRPTHYASVAYWYLAPDGMDPYPTCQVSERTGYYDTTGALEGENLPVMNRTNGIVEIQDMRNRQGASPWSGGAQLWWWGTKPGDQLTLEFPVRKTGKYELKAQFTKGRGYGVAQLSVDDSKINDPVDLSDTKPALPLPNGWISLGTFSFKEGNHKLMIEMLHANDEPKKEKMFGLDSLKLEPLK